MLNTPVVNPARALSPWRWGSFAVLLPVAVVLALVLSGCTLSLSTGKQLSDEASTTKDGVVLDLDGATLTVPAGAVAPGTTVAATMTAGAETKSAATPSAGATSGADLLPAASGQLAVTVGQELEPGASMTVTLALTNVPKDAGFETSTAALAVAHVPTGATEPELIRAAWAGDGGNGRVSAQVPADGTFWAVHVDVPELLNQVTDLLDNNAGSQPAAKQECSDKPVSAAGRLFTAAQDTGVQTCLREHHGMLMVKVSAVPSRQDGQAAQTVAAVPLRVASQEKLSGTPALDQAVLQPYFHQLLRPLLEAHHDLAPAMPGAGVEYETAAAGVEHHEWELRPYPAMFLLEHLATMVQQTLDSDADPAGIDASRTAACAAPLLEANKDKVALEESWAQPFVQAFMACVAGSLEISPRMDVLLGAANAVPALVAGAAVERWGERNAGESATVAIAGELEWSTYSATINDAQISFEHPVAWTVMDGSVNQQFSASNSLVIYDHDGNRVARLEIIDGFHASGPMDMRPVTYLGGGSGLLPSAMPDMQVRSVAMDLSAEPQLRTRNRLEKNVEVNMSLTGIPHDGAKASKLVVGMLTGTVQVETGVKSPIQNQTRRFVSFGHSTAFDTLAQAQQYSNGAEFAAIQKMLASFKG